MYGAGHNFNSINKSEFVLSEVPLPAHLKISMGGTPCVRGCARLEEAHASAKAIENFAQSADEVTERQIPVTHEGPRFGGTLQDGVLSASFEDAVH
jgi:hypothetical protein